MVSQHINLNDTLLTHLASVPTSRLSSILKAELTHSQIDKLETALAVENDSHQGEVVPYGDMPLRALIRDDLEFLTRRRQPSKREVHRILADCLITVVQTLREELTTSGRLSNGVEKFLNDEEAQLVALVETKAAA